MTIEKGEERVLHLPEEGLPAERGTPSGDEVAHALVCLGGRGSARLVCTHLVSHGYERARAQLAIQRAVGDQIAVNDDWTLSLSAESINNAEAMAYEALQNAFEKYTDILHHSSKMEEREAWVEEGWSIYVSGTSDMGITLTVNSPREEPVMVVPLQTLLKDEVWHIIDQTDVPYGRALLKELQAGVRSIQHAVSAAQEKSDELGSAGIVHE